MEFMKDFMDKVQKNDEANILKQLKEAAIHFIQNSSQHQADQCS
jgi:hypothetical protein